ncbi:MAG: TolB family protein [Acidimicrobiales bacterium]
MSHRLSGRHGVARWLIAAVVAAGSAVVPGARPTDAAVAGEVTLASHTPVSPATTPVGASDSADSSADGAFVVFQSTAPNLVTGQSDASNTNDVFLFERATGVVTLVSHNPASSTTTANASSFSPSISADGAFMAFHSLATNLVAGQIDANGAFDVFLFERATGAVTLVSHTPASATTANAISFSPSISADGAFVAFHASATNLVAGQIDANGVEDVFLFQRATGAVTLVSRTPASATTTANANSFSPSISADGAYVAFHSPATNLVAGQSDANGAQDVFLLEQATGAVTLVSHTPASATTTANASSFIPSIAADGAFVAFESYTTNLAAGQIDANGVEDVFLFQRATGAVTLVSHTPASATTTTTTNLRLLPTSDAAAAEL